MVASCTEVINPKEVISLPYHALRYALTNRIP